MGLFTLVPLAARRLVTRWQLFLPLLAGAILAVALTSSAFIYGDAVRQLGLRFAFDQQAREHLNIHLLAYNAPSSADAYATVRRQVEGAINLNVGWYVDSQTRGAKGSTFFVNQVLRTGQAPDLSDEGIASRDAANEKLDPRPRGFFLTRDAFGEKTKIVAGATPPDLAVTVDERGRPLLFPEIPVIVLNSTATVKLLNVGDRVLLVPYWEDASRNLVARVAAIAEPKDPRDPFWFTDAATEITELEPQNFIAMYVSEKTFFDGVARLVPKMLTDYSWALFVSPNEIDAVNAGVAQAGLERMDTQLERALSTGFLMRTDLDLALRSFSTKDVFGRVPLLIVTVMIVSILLYYLIMVASVVVDRHLGEVALLRSRGAETTQVLLLYMWEAVFITTAAFTLGPVLAWVATSYLGYTSVFSALTGGGALPAKVTPDTIVIAGLASLAVLIALLLPTIKGMGLNLLQFKAGAARPAAQSFLTRYYVDVFLAIMAGVLFWELTQRGSLISTTLLGQTGVDRLLLAAPALILLAVALVFLRLFPYVVGGAGWVIAKVGSVWMVLGMWHLGRNPLPYALPILLLMLASSVAMFAANFGATVNQSYQDRASYAAGAEVRVSETRISRTAATLPLIQQYATPDDVETTPVFRSRMGIAMRIFSFNSYDYIAVDPETFAKAAWYRDDLSRDSLENLMNVLASDTPGREPGIGLPGGVSSVGVWAKPVTPRRGLMLKARIGDSQGKYRDVALGNLESPDWKLYQVDLGLLSRAQGGLRGPLRVVGLKVDHASGLQPGGVYLDSVEAFGSTGGVRLFDFRNVGDLQVLRDSSIASGDSLQVTTAVVRPGRESSALFIWGEGPAGITRGLLLPGSTNIAEPLKAIVSRTFLEREKVAVGDRLLVSTSQHTMPLRIEAVADFFPTMDPYRNGFVVLNLPGLMERINTAGTTFETTANEIWARPDSREAKTRLLQALRGVAKEDLHDRDRVLDTFQADPLVAAGWDGVLRMAFVAVLFATLMGFSIYSLVLAQRRRMEFAMLRSLGMSLGGVAGVVILEQAVVVGVGLALGSWLGIQVTSLLMPFLGLNEAGTRVLPPFAVTTSWSAVLITYGIMSAVFVLATLAVIGVFSRTAIQKALRFGEA